MDQEFLPVFVLGAGHSGTGILYRMLALHPDFAWFSQFSQRTGTVSERKRMPLGRPADALLRKILRHDWRKLHGGWRQKLFPRPKEAHAIWDHILPADEAIPEEESVKRMREVLEGERAFWRKDRFIAKLPRLYLQIPRILKAYPNARFVLIIRDGRAVALSHRHKRKKLQRGLPTDELLRRAAGFWTDVIAHADRHIEERNLITVRYEDLCADVHGQLERILIFCDLPVERFPFELCPATLTPTNHKWFEIATTDEMTLLHDVIGTELERFGYDNRDLRSSGTSTR